MHNGKNALLYTRYFTLLLEDPCSRSQGGVEVAGVDRVGSMKITNQGHILQRNVVPALCNNVDQ